MNLVSVLQRLSDQRWTQMEAMLLTASRELIIQELYTPCQIEVYYVTDEPIWQRLHRRVARP